MATYEDALERINAEIERMANAVWNMGAYPTGLGRLNALHKLDDRLTALALEHGLDVLGSLSGNDLWIEAEPAEEGTTDEHG